MQKNTHSVERKEISTITGGVGEGFVKLEKDPEVRLITELGRCWRLLGGAGRPLGLGPTFT